MRFHATIQQNGKTATGIRVPEAVVKSLGAGKRPAVRVTINGYSYRSTVAVMGGASMIALSAENRTAAGVAGGDEVDVDLELDTTPREVSVPADLDEALNQDPEARRFFDHLSYSNKLRHIHSIEQAKTAETRQRRIAKAVELFREGRA
jgi:antitoxin component of MazEF toxin-antitoxin module